MTISRISCGWRSGNRSFCRSALAEWAVLLGLLAVTLALPGWAEPVEIHGLRSSAEIFRDEEGIPHVFAKSEEDAFLLLGYLHAEERFFQMDFFRHLFEGKLSELVGPGGLASDVQFRQFRFRSNAERSIRLYSRSGRRILRAYARGVNAYLDENPLPVEYGLLELTGETIRPWRAADGLLLLKGFSSGAWLDLSDIDRTLALAAFVEAGAQGGFDGMTLFFEDVFRLAPIEAEVTAPGGSEVAFGGGGASSRAAVGPTMGFLPSSEVLDVARRLRDQLAAVPALIPTLEGSGSGLGSNWWIFGPSMTDDGQPILANDPHQFLAAPPTVYLAHLVIGRHHVIRNLSGSTFAGIPAMVSGCNENACWGATNNAFDLTDTFAEQVVIDPVSGKPTHTLFRGHRERLLTLSPSYRANQLGDGVADNLVDVVLPPSAGGELYFVPRRNFGPLMIVGPPVDGIAAGLSIQYAGWSPNQDLESFFRIHRARRVRDFARALRFADGFLFNMAYADRGGNIAYFTTGELPLREDLQELERVDGAPPFLIRDGSGNFYNEWSRRRHHAPFRALPFDILPFGEMPHVINPAGDLLISSNNDPVGNTLDNDVLNELRPRGGIYYLNRSHVSLRAAKARRLIDDLLADGGSIGAGEVEALQASSEMPDAEILVPFLADAWARALAATAPPRLSALTSDPALAEAVSRLTAWDFTTPTGIREGYDAGDDPDLLPEPTPGEVASSVAATLFSVFRGRLIERVVDETLGDLGLGASLPSARQAHVALIELLRRSEAGAGSRSGVDFFAGTGLANPSDARAVVLLEALQGTLTLLSGPSFATAFGGSVNQDDYRWGRLHRITLPHPLGGPFNIPPSGGFQDLAPGLPGLARAGGFEALDVAGHDLRAADDRSFTFGLAAGARTYFLLGDREITSFEIISGGQTGDPRDPAYAGQLPSWLTNRYERFLTDPAEAQKEAVSRELFLPSY